MTKFLEVEFNVKQLTTPNHALINLNASSTFSKFHQYSLMSALIYQNLIMISEESIFAKPKMPNPAVGTHSVISTR